MQVEPPLQHEFHSWFGEAPVSHRPTEEEEILVVSGTDFEGLMRLARMSLGLSLWQQQLAEDALLDDNHYFWLHYLSAMVTLNAASDRLRIFFVMAFFREKINTYDKRKGIGRGTNTSGIKHHSSKQETPINRWEIRLASSLPWLRISFATETTEIEWSMKSPQGSEKGNAS